jgi:hypothetical protein
VKKFFIVLLLCVLLPCSLFAAADEYKTGSMMFTFKAGTTMPAFVKFFDSSSGYTEPFVLFGDGDNKTKLNWGGYFSLSFEGFTTSKLSLGGELGYDFNYTIGSTIFSIVPLFFKVTYYPFQGFFDMPISIGLGGSYWRYGTDKSLLTLYSNVDVGFVFYFWDNWGIGLHTGLWLVPELDYKKDDWNNNGIIGFMPITLSVTYRS